MRIPACVASRVRVPDSGQGHGLTFVASRLGRVGEGPPSWLRAFLRVATEWPFRVAALVRVYHAARSGDYGGVFPHRGRAASSTAPIGCCCSFDITARFGHTCQDREAGGRMDR